MQDDSKIPRVGTPRPLSRPPIKEALIDFRIATDRVIDVALLSGIREAIAGEYPEVEERREMRAEIRFDAQGVRPSAEDLGFHGLFCKTSDGNRIAQFRRDGFTLNKLPPYLNAEEMIAEALRLWPLYREAVAPTAVTRVAFRYINSLNLPYGPHDEFDRFLTAPPPTPPGVPQSVSTFLTRVVTHEDQDVAIITHTMDATVGDGVAQAFTIDIDVYREADLLPDDEQLRAVLNELRELKNRVFFALLTDEALDLFT